MFMIPGSRSSLTETLEHTVGSSNHVEIDQSCHDALKGGGLSSLTTDGPMGAIGSMTIPALPSSPMPALSAGSMASSSALSMPLPAMPTSSDGMSEGLDDETEMQELSIKVKKGEICIKVGLALLPQLAFIEQDWSHDMSSLPWGS